MGKWQGAGNGHGSSSKPSILQWPKTYMPHKEFAE